MKKAFKLKEKEFLYVIDKKYSVDKPKEEYTLDKMDKLLILVLKLNLIMIPTIAMVALVKTLVKFP